MSTAELRRVEVFGQVASRSLRSLDAAEILQLSYRHTKRLWRRYRQEGAASLQHRSAGRPSHHAKPTAFREQVLQLLRAKYSSSLQEHFGPTLAAEHLQAEYLSALNQRFAQNPARPEEYHRPKPSAAGLDAIFRLETERGVSNDWVVRYHGFCLQKPRAPKTRRRGTQESPVGSTATRRSRRGKRREGQKPIENSRVVFPIYLRLRWDQGLPAKLFT